MFGCSPPSDANGCRMLVRPFRTPIRKHNENGFPGGSNQCVMQGAAIHPDRSTPSAAMKTRTHLRSVGATPQACQSLRWRRPSARHRFPIGTEKFPQLRGIELGLLERREVPAARGLRYAYNIRRAL